MIIIDKLIPAHLLLHRVIICFSKYAYYIITYVLYVQRTDVAAPTTTGGRSPTADRLTPSISDAKSHDAYVVGPYGIEPPGARIKIKQKLYQPHTSLVVCT
jgi:hypothetical protein